MAVGAPDAYDELMGLLAFVIFFPFSAIFLAGRWLVRRQKRMTRSHQGPP